jgi:hypothetical protein
MPLGLTNHEPKYSSPEVAIRALDTLSSLEAKVKGLGIEVSTGSNWYHRILMVQSPETYRSVSAIEDLRSTPWRLTYVFETIRLDNDGEILYRGCTLDEGLENLEEELLKEFQRQHGWAKSAFQRKQEKAARVEAKVAAWNKIRGDFPNHHRSAHSSMLPSGEIQYGITIGNLTENQLRYLLRMVERGTIPDGEPIELFDDLVVMEAPCETECEEATRRC